MKITTWLSTATFALIVSGCASNSMGVTPSQNNTLQAVSPSETAASEGGAMQRSLDSWLKEEWTPMTAESTPVIKTTTKEDGTVIQTKREATQVVTTTTAPDGSVVTTTATVVPEPVDETPFTLQKYADKWKVYNDNKEKMNAGKPKEASHLDTIERMPVIGK